MRAPAVPLVTVDPHLNVWSMADTLYNNFTDHWTSKNHGMTGIIAIDNKPYLFMGKLFPSNEGSKGPINVISQKSYHIKALTTKYIFEGAGISLNVEFTTPLLCDNLDVLSRPVSYINFNVESLDKQPHDVKIYFDMTAEWCVNHNNQKVVSTKKDLENAKLLGFGTEEQKILNSSGDDRRIDWGYQYLVLPKKHNIASVISSHNVRRSFIENGKIDTIDDTDFPRPVGNKVPVAACIIDFGTIKDTSSSALIAVAYDDIYSVEYFNEKLTGYWNRNNIGFEQVVIDAVNQYNELKEQCDAFDAKLYDDGKKAGGEKYAKMLELGYRQVIAAHKLVVDKKGEILFLSKENFSNGCMGTVDVSYPSIPQFLLYNVELVKGMLRPIFEYSRKAEWIYDFAPHDIGQYPLANGQVYGLNKETKSFTDEMQMPVEECCNMIIMTAAVCIIEKNAEFAKQNFDLLEKWVEYLVENGQDPGNQLCTDDFAGHLAHNTNLSI